MPNDNTCGLILQKLHILFLISVPRFSSQFKLLIAIFQNHLPTCPFSTAGDACNESPYNYAFGLCRLMPLPHGARLLRGFCPSLFYLGTGMASYIFKLPVPYLRTFFSGCVSQHSSSSFLPLWLLFFKKKVSPILGGGGQRPGKATPK